MINKNQLGSVTDKEIRELVVARLRSFPSGKKISIGSDGEFSKEELIKSVEADNEIGKKITNIQLNYLRFLKEGIFSND